MVTACCNHDNSVEKSKYFDRSLPRNFVVCFRSNQSKCVNIDKHLRMTYGRLATISNDTTSNTNHRLRWNGSTDQMPKFFSDESFEMFSSSFTFANPSPVHQKCESIETLPPKQWWQNICAERLVNWSHTKYLLFFTHTHVDTSWKFSASTQNGLTSKY